MVAGLVGDRGGLDQLGQRLAAQDLLDQLGHVVVLEHVVDELLRVLTGLLRTAHHVLGQLLLLDPDLLLLGDLVEDQLGGDGVTNAALEVCLELLDRLLLVLEVLLEGEAGEAELLLDALTARVELVGDDALRQRDLDLLQEGLENGVTGGRGLLEALAVAEAAADVLLELLDGVELAGELGEVVVVLGELLLLHLVDGDVDVDLLADQLTAHEGALEVGGLAGGQTGDGLVEAVEHAALADLVAHPDSLGAVDVLAVLGGLQVDDHEVTVGGGPLDVLEGAEALTHRLDLLLDVGVGELDVVDLGLDALVVGQRDLGLDVDLGGELQRLVVLELGDLDLGLRERLERVLLEGFEVHLREDVVDRLGEHRTAADLLVDHLGRDLAAAEAGDIDLLGDLLVRRVEARLELLEGHLDGQLGPGRAQRLDGALHRVSPVVGS